MTDHVRNIESAARPMLALGLMAAFPLMQVFAPFILVGVVLFVLYVFVGWTWAAAMLPFAPSDAVLEQALLERFGAGGAIWGAFAVLALAYVAIGLWGWFYRLWPLANFRLAGALLAAYAMAVGVAGSVRGTHYPSMVAYAWSNPGRSPMKAWNCPASVRSGEAMGEGRYDIYTCIAYVGQPDFREACRQLMRRMEPLKFPQTACASHIREITGHYWPRAGEVYQEWDRSFIKPFRNAPLATPAIMRALLEKEGLTPLK